MKLVIPDSFLAGISNELKDYQTYRPYNISTGLNKGN